jgi:hypothetical protein
VLYQLSYLATDESSQGATHMQKLTHTNIRNLFRCEASGIYYGIVKMNGKQKCKRHGVIRFILHIRLRLGIDTNIMNVSRRTFCASSVEALS